MKQPTVRLVIIGVLGLLFGIIIFILSTEVNRSMKGLLARYEEDHIQQHAETASVFLRASLGALSDVTRDWSRWDATYAFATEKNQHFLQNELNDDLFNLYRLNFAFVFNKNYDVVYERFFDLTTSQTIEPSADLKSLVTDFKHLLTKESSTHSVTDFSLVDSPGISGFVRKNNTWVYLSAFPIIRSSGQGPSNGVLLFGRVIDDIELLRMKKNGVLTIQRLSSAQIEALFAKNAFANGSYSIDLSTAGVIRAFCLLPQAFGDNIVIGIEEERIVYNQGMDIIRALDIFIVLTVVVTLVLLFFLLEKLLFSPLKKLAEYVSHISDVNVLSEPPQHWGYELAAFAQALRTMLSKLAETQKTIAAQNAEMRHTLTHDQLTGLPNTFQCECVFEETQNTESELCPAMHLFYIKFTNLRLVNATLGFSSGDAVLVTMGKRLQEYCLDALSVACVDGHHFLVLYTADTLGDTDVEGKCAAISAFLEEPVSLDDHSVRPSLAIGVASYPLDCHNVMELRRNATLAANAVPLNARPNYLVYDEMFLQQVTTKAHMEEALLKALENDELVPYFQPKLNLATKKIAGTEALVRWVSPEGIIMPGQFLPVADATGLIVQITWLMLEKACRENQRFAAAGFSVVVSVNVPVQVILHTDFVQHTLAILKKTGMPSCNLEIEITEEAVIADIAKTKHVIEELHRYNIKVSVDDFGTGYSSLQYLKKVPFDTIKIDKIFVDDVPGDKYNEAIIKASISMAEALELKVVVEGVETKQQWDVLEAMGCKEVQGYVVSKPVNPDAFIDLLRKWNLPPGQ